MKILIKVRCDCRDGKVKRVEFVNQPAFCYELGRRIIVDGVGEITVDIAYGGMTYAIADAGALGFRLDPSEARDLCTLGQRIKKAAAEQITVKHPENPAIPRITQTRFAHSLRRKAYPGGPKRSGIVAILGRHGRRPLQTRPIALPAVGGAASCFAVTLQVLQVPAGQLHQHPGCGREVGIVAGDKGEGLIQRRVEGDPVQTSGIAQVPGQGERDDGVADAAGGEGERRGRGLNLNHGDEGDTCLLGAFE